MVSFAAHYPTLQRLRGKATDGLGWSFALTLLLGCYGCRRSASERDASVQTPGTAVETLAVGTASASPMASLRGNATIGTASPERGLPRAGNVTVQPPPNGDRSSTPSSAAPVAPSVVTSTSSAAAPLVPSGNPTAGSPSVSELPHFFPNAANATRKRPLLLFLHGFGANGGSAFEVLGLAELGRKYEIFVVAPDGTRDSQNRRFWNAHPACCNFENEKTDHVRYLSMLVEQMIASYPVDASKLYVVGFSNGGFMAHRLACAWGGRLRGIVSVAGAGPDASLACEIPKDLRVLEMHGDADPTVFYGGGTIFERKGITYDSAMTTFTGWGRRLGCAGDPVSEGTLDLDPKLPGEETTILTYRRCARGTASLWTVRGGSHMFGNRPSVMEKAWLFLNSNSP